MPIDHYKRYQTGLTVEELYPARTDKICACGCEKPLPPRRRRWATKACQKAAISRFFIIKGDTKEIRKQLEERDKGACRGCGEIVRHWDADHIIPVHKGGGGCELDNFQILCNDCHREKTKKDLSENN